MKVTELKQIQVILSKELNILQEREAKFAGYAPLDLLNQIEDYETAINATVGLMSQQLSEAEWREALEPLNLSLNVTKKLFYDNLVFIL